MTSNHGNTPTPTERVAVAARANLPGGLDLLTGFACPCEGELGKRVARLISYGTAVGTLSQTLATLATCKDIQPDDSLITGLTSDANLAGLLAALALLTDEAVTAAEWFDAAAGAGRLRFDPEPSRKPAVA